MSYNTLLSKLPFLKQKSRIYRSINGAGKKVSKLANKYENLIYYKSNVKAKEEKMEYSIHGAWTGVKSFGKA